jgi:carboxypeptidase Taq
MTLEQAVQNLTDLQKKASAYRHALGLLFYDGATSAPRGTAANRSRTTSVLSQALYRLNTSPETADLLSFLDENRDRLDVRQRRAVELLRKESVRLERIPPEEYAAFRRLGTEAGAVWREAKDRSDYSLFEPFLRKRFDMSRRIASYCAPDADPCDYWLDSNEEGLSRAACDTFFLAVRSRVVPLLQAVMSCPRPDNAVIKGVFPAARQAVLARRLMAILRLDPLHVGFSTTEHPFTTSLGSHLDGRITTHYYEEDYSFSMFSVIHEGGHALYNSGSDDSLLYTVLDGGASAGIHESQSRFYENCLGRSRAFCEYLFPVLREIFPEHLRAFSAEDFFRAVNRVEPSLIRTQADELTYCLHIMVRYELETAMMAGDLDAHDLPGEWNRLYRETLGVDVPDDRRGVLQDCHWADGYLGYFPSYALGNAYAAQFLSRMRETVDVDQCLLRGDLAPVNDWNREHIWQYGRLHRPSDLFRMAAGKPFDPAFYTDYLEKKYSALYRL